jgi:RND family efflux transporter MFP subunit
VKTFLQWTLPLVVVAAAVLVAALLIVNRPEVETQVPEPIPPVVRVLTVEPGEQRWSVRSQGTVRPRTEVRLVAEVSARVTEVSPSLVGGGFFEAGELLVRLDARDFEFAAAGARAEVARAQLALEREQAEADVARREWQDLGTGEASGLALREPQLAGARATLEAARAALGRAELDLERTEIRAPYTGRVRTERVDVGQFLNRAEELASVYAIDVAEVRLPVRDAELAALELPSGRAGAGSGEGPAVTFRADFGGEERSWVGRVVRSEGELDPKSRMVALIAEVEDPYGVRSEGSAAPLSVGLFVEAEIRGRAVPDVIALPRPALREGSRVLVVDEQERLRWRPVEVLRTGREKVYVGAGLAAGERVCLSPLATVVEGMRVRVEQGEQP